jgi:hypothetical protein
MRMFNGIDRRGVVAVFPECTLSCFSLVVFRAARAK